MRRSALLALLLAILATVAGAARAHTRDQVYSSWTVDGTWIEAEIRVPARLTMRSRSAGTAARSDDALAGHFLRTLRVSLGSSLCTPGKGTLTRPGPEFTVMEFAWRCPTPRAAPARAPLHLKIDSLFGRLPNHVHFARLRLPGGKMDERIFTNGVRQHTVAPPAAEAIESRSWLSIAAGYSGLGITHILAGADHLAFVLGLMLVAAGLRALLLIVTGFTLGHSLTLALSITDTLTPAGAAVEALIGFTVALVAAEASSRASGRGLAVAATTLPLAGLAIAATIFSSALPAFAWMGLILFTGTYTVLTRRADGTRWATALAAAFGLVHGFGFAGVLQDIGLPESRLVPALLGFNLGVETGQLLAIGLALGLAAAAKRLIAKDLQLWATQGLAAGLCGLGVFWFVSRAFAG